MAGPPDTRLISTSPGQFPTAAKEKWTVIIKQRSREEEKLAGKGRLINTQRKKQACGRIIR